MKRTIKVFVGDAASWVGTLHYDAVGSRERSAFEYAERGWAQKTASRLSRRFRWWQVRNFIAKFQTVRFFMGHLLTRSRMAGPGESSCATMPSAARQPAGPVKEQEVSSASGNRLPARGG